MAGRFSVEAVFKAVDRVTAPVTKMQNRVGKFTRSMEAGMRRADKAMSKVAGGIKSLARTATVSFGIMAAALAPVMATGAEFEQAITDVGAVSLQTRKQIAPLEEMALNLGRTTKFTATQAANAMEVLSRAGFNTNEILQATPAVLSAAAASGLEIAEVADHVSNALKGMGLETNQAAMVADVLSLASAKTNSSIGSLGESIRNVASTARELNIPFESVAASVALLQDVGLDASVAGSAFNTMLTKMAAPTAGITKKMKKFGISFKDAEGNMLPLEKVLGQLNIASKKAGGNFDKVAFLAELVGLRGQKAASNLGTLFETGKLEKLVAELENAEGSAKKMADLRMNTVTGSMQLLGSAVDAVKVKIFGMNEGPIKDTIDKMTAWVSANEDLIASKVGKFVEELITNLPKIVMWMERIGIALLVFAGLSFLIKAATIAMAAFNLVMMANPLFLFAAVIAGIIVYVDELIAAFEKLPAIIQFAMLPLKLLLEAIKFVKDGLGTIGGAIIEFFGGSEESAEEQAAASAQAQVASPQERVARNIEEQRSTSTSEVTIKDETGKAQVTDGKQGKGLTLIQSGGF